MPASRTRGRGSWSGSARSTPSAGPSRRRHGSSQHSPPASSHQQQRRQVPALGRRRAGTGASGSSQPHGAFGESTPAPSSQRRHGTQSSQSLFHRPSSVVPSHEVSRPNELLEEESEDHDPFQEEVIMAVDMKENGTLGCAYFETEKGALLLCRDIPLSDIDTAEQLLTHVQPTTVLISGRAPEHLMTFVEEYAVSRKDGDPNSRFILRVLVSSEFASKAAQDRLVDLHAALHPHDPTLMANVEDPNQEAIDGFLHDDINGDPEHRGIQVIRCGSSVDLDSLVTIGCAGALLGELNRRRSGEYLPDGTGPGSAFKIERLEAFSLADTMYITQDTMQALQIMRSEQHPNSKISGGVQSASGSKESLSVYGLFHQLAGTPQGKVALRKMFLWPTTNLATITARHDFITFFRRPGHTEHLLEASKACRKIANARRNLAQLRKGAESPSLGQSHNKGAWATLKRFATHVLRLREIIANMRGYEEIEVLRLMVDTVPTRPLIAVGEMIERTIDFEDSKARFRSCVKAGVDPQLDEVRRQYDGMSSFLTHVVVHLRRQIPEWASQYIRSCIFLPQLGFLTVVEQDPISGNGKFEGEGGQLREWTKMFVVEDGACYKNTYMKELDDHYGDAYCEIGDREVEILYQLSKQVLEQEEVLASTSDLCGRFDALLALALGAEKYNWNRPEVTDSSSVLRIEEGRHALQELVVPCFVPNSCFLGLPTTMQSDADDEIGSAPRGLILTGPNHSGKSVYLKQAAVIIYLAQIGSFVPAKSAVIGIVDKILARVSSKESVSRIESAFAMDLKQIAQVIRGATAKSLVLVDEFGNGTSSDDGAGLMAAFIDHLLTRESGCPRVLMATHFHEILEGGYLRHHRRLALAHLEVRVGGEGRDSDGTQLTYLFTLAPGHSSSSFGGRCAALNGVPSAIIQRADVLSEMIARNEDLVAACAELSVREEAALEAAEGVARRFLQVDLEHLPDGESEGGSFKRMLQDVLQL